MDEREIQKILYGFSGGFFLAGFLMIYLGNSGFSTIIFGFTVLLIGMASVGPSTIKTWGAKWGSDGGQIGFDRYKPTATERKLVLKLAQDKPSPEIEKEGEKFIAKAEERSPEQRSPEDYLALATEKWRAKNYDGALAHVYAGLALNPENIRIKASLVNRKGSIFHFLGLENEGIQYYKEAIELDPGFSWPHNNLGVIYYKHGKLEEARSEYYEAIVLDSKWSFPHSNMGNLYANQGKLKEAKKEYEEALRLDPEDSMAKENLEKLKRKMKEGK